MSCNILRIYLHISNWRFLISKGKIKSNLNFCMHKYRNLCKFANVFIAEEQTDKLYEKAISFSKLLNFDFESCVFARKITKGQRKSLMLLK